MRHRHRQWTLTALHKVHSTAFGPPAMPMVGRTGKMIERFPRKRHAPCSGVHWWQSITAPPLLEQDIAVLPIGKTGKLTGPSLQSQSNETSGQTTSRVRGPGPGTAKPQPAPADSWEAAIAGSSLVRTTYPQYGPPPGSRIQPATGGCRAVYSLSRTTSKQCGPLPGSRLRLAAGQ
jgi:hypothetical protein